MSKRDNGGPEPVAAGGESGKPANVKIDEIIKYLFSSEKQALIKLVNSALGESHDPDTSELVELKTEFIRRKAGAGGPRAEPFDLDKAAADMMFMLNGTAYHIEIQTKADRTIAIRIVGYGAGHALSKLGGNGAGGGVVFEFPVPVLIQIDKDANLPDRIPALIKLSGQDGGLAIGITVIKLWEHGVEALVERGFYLLLPFVLARHRKKKKTAKNVQALIADIQKIEEAIAGLYEKGEIYSNLRSDLYAATGSIAQNINERHYGNNLEIERELEKMETERALFAVEIKAKGVAEGEAKGMAKGMAKGEAKGEARALEIIKLYMQKKAPGTISNELDISLKKVNTILKKSGLTELSQ